MEGREESFLLVPPGNWGSGKPAGIIKDVKTEDTVIKSKNNKDIKKKGDEENPA